MTMPPRSRRSSRRSRPRCSPPFVMAGLGPAIRTRTVARRMAGTSPAMTDSVEGRRLTRDAMTDDLSALKADTEAALATATDLRAWDAVRVATLGRNGRLTAL